MKKIKKNKSIKNVVLLALSAIALPSAAQADDYSRAGWYAGGNFAQGFNFITEAIDVKTGSKIDTEDTWGLNIRGGYRFNSWLAVEGVYEFMEGFETESLVGSTKTRTNSLMIGPKFVMPFWRTQPYLGIGLGTQYGNLDYKSSILRERSGNKTDWSLAIRPALGLDFYITEQFVANLELAGVFVSGKFENFGMSVSDPIYLSLGAGLQYRF
ncbi:MAG: porin family protein [Psychromonas sp.]